MSSFKSPVGPQPSSVYWRRRLVVGLGALVVLIVIVLIIVRPGSGGATPASTSTNSPSTGSDTATGGDTSTSPEASATPTAAPLDGACDPADISVVAITDAATYDPGANPLLSLSVTNTGEAECAMNVGSDVQEYRITSGEELIWSSKDCQTDAVSQTTELLPGVTVTSAPFAWNRTRSDAGGDCAAAREAVTAEGASYHLSVILDGVESADTKQFILN